MVMPWAEYAWYHKFLFNFYHSLSKFNRQQICDIFLFLYQKAGFDISCKLSPLETICMKCQILFSEKSKKNISICPRLKILPWVLSVKHLLGLTIVRANKSMYPIVALFSIKRYEYFPFFSPQKHMFFFLRINKQKSYVDTPSYLELCSTAHCSDKALFKPETIIVFLFLYKNVCYGYWVPQHSFCGEIIEISCLPYLPYIFRHH